MVIEDSALGSRVSLGAALAGELALPIRGTRWAVVPSLTLGVRAATQPMIGTLAEALALGRRAGPISVRIGLAMMQMVVEDTGRARFVERGAGACAAVHYHARRELALVLSLTHGWFGDQVSITSSTIGAAWTP
jgi:hypothetical protein